MKITTPTDCDNCPERRLVKDFLIAWHLGQWDQINNTLHSDFSFHLVEKSQTISKDDLQLYINSQRKLEHLNLEKITSSGKFGACKAHAVEANKTTNFAYFLEFSSVESNIIKSVVQYNVNQM